jgi:hypothetical protein
MASRALLLFLLALPAWAAEVSGFRIDDKTRVGNTELALSGAGVRKRVFFEVYAIGLYMRDPKSDPIAQPGPKRVAIHMLRDVGADQFSEALADGMRANHSEAEYQGLEGRISALSAIMSELKEARKGMALALDWDGKETQLVVDGKPAGRPIGGEDFYRGLLRIWLGDKPVQEDLKKALLGRG